MVRQTLAKKPRCIPTFIGPIIAAQILVACSNGYPTSPTKSVIVPKTEIVPVERGKISVAPPPGFCKDARTSRSNTNSTVLIFANCNVLNRTGYASTDWDTFSGVITTNIAKTPAFEETQKISNLSTYLSSNAGLETLSSSGDAESIEIIDKRQSEDGVFIQLKDENAALSKNVWKSFLNRSDHLVTVSLLQNEDTNLSPEQVMQFLQSYSETIKVGTALSEPSNAQTLQTNTPTTAQQDYLPEVKDFNKVGILRRLLL